MNILPNGFIQKTRFKCAVHLKVQRSNWFREL